MKLGVLAALDQRIGLRYAMAPMTDTETRSYLRRHLKLAGRNDALFSDDAVGLIHQTSRGYPRAVNNLALQALVAAFAADKARRRRILHPHGCCRSNGRLNTTPTPPNTTDPAGHVPAGHFILTHPHRKCRRHAHPECRSTPRVALSLTVRSALTAIYLSGDRRLRFPHAQDYPEIPCAASV